MLLGLPLFLKWPVGVVFIATNQNLAVGEVYWRWVHRTVRCATGQCPVHRHVILSLGLGAGRSLEALSSYGTGQSGAPLTAALTSVAVLFIRQSRPLRADSRYSAGAPDSLMVHRTLSGGTPDSPVNYSGAAPGKPEGEEFELIHPGAPDTVRCARPGQPSVSFLLLCFET
jgi:hypothetical protein